jgi:hypothetical protein
VERLGKEPVCGDDGGREKLSVLQVVVASTYRVSVPRAGERPRRACMDCPNLGTCTASASAG